MRPVPDQLIDHDLATLVRERLELREPRLPARFVPPVERPVRRRWVIAATIAAFLLGLSVALLIHPTTATSVLSGLLGRPSTTAAPAPSARPGGAAPVVSPAPAPSQPGGSPSPGGPDGGQAAGVPPTPAPTPSSGGDTIQLPLPPLPLPTPSGGVPIPVPSLPLPPLPLPTPSGGGLLPPLQPTPTPT
jgi:hypothetical protein